MDPGRRRGVGRRANAGVCLCGDCMYGVHYEGMGVFSTHSRYQVWYIGIMQGCFVYVVVHRDRGVEHDIAGRFCLVWY